VVPLHYITPFLLPREPGDRLSAFPPEKPGKGESDMSEEQATEEMSEEENLEFRKHLADNWEDDWDGEVALQTPVDPSAAIKEENPASPAAVSKEEEPAPNPWADVPQAMQDLLTTLNTTVSGMDNRLKQTESRLGGIQNEFYAAKQAAAEGGDTPTTEEMATAGKDSEKWAALKSDFPEWAEAVDERLSAIPTTRGVDSEALSAAVKEALPDAASPADIQMGLLMFFQPDWQKKRKNLQYEPWLATQTDAVKAQSESNSASDAVAVLDLFDEHLGSVKTPSTIVAERKARLSRGLAPNAREAVRQKNDIDMTEAEFRETAAAEVFADD